MSYVWKYFEKIDKKVRCLLCKKELAYNSGSTGSMINHLKLLHPATKKDAESPDQPKMANFFSPRNCDKVRSKKITGLLADIIVKDLLPIKIVESLRFKALMDFLEPKYEMPCRSSMTAFINREYDSAKETLKLNLNNAEQVSITTDSWMSSKAESYTTITGHYIDNNWELNSVVLATRYIDVSHTSTNLQNKIKEITEEFGILNKLLACVHDNAANIDRAKKDFEAVKVSTSCTAHTLQLCVNSSLDKSKVMTSATAAGKRLVGHFKHSYKATDALKGKQREMGLPEHKLLQQCATRWNSTLDMYERLLEQRWAICAVLSDRNVTTLSLARTLELKDEYWQAMEEICSCLQSLKLATTAISAEKSVSSSLVAPIIFSLKNHHLKHCDDDSVFLKDFKINIRNEIERRFKNIFHAETSDEVDAFLLSAFLDPRHKSLLFLTENLKNLIKQFAIHLLEQIEVIEPQTENKNKKIKCDSAIDQLLGNIYASAEPESSSFNTTEQELQHYLLLPQISSSDDPLLWWKEHQQTVPKLAKLAKSYLAVPATSVPSERMFSAAGRLITKLRSSLSPKNVDMILFLNKN